MVVLEVGRRLTSTLKETNIMLGNICEIHFPWNLEHGYYYNTSTHSLAIWNLILCSIYFVLLLIKKTLKTLISQKGANKTRITDKFHLHFKKQHLKLT